MYCSYLLDAQNSIRPKGYWNVLNSIITGNNEGTHFPTQIIYDNVVSKSPSEICTILNNYFSKIGSSLTENLAQNM